jgi:hypothetical protein
MITQKTFGAEFDDLAPSSATSDENPFTTMMASFDDAAARLGLEPDLYEILRKPDREIHVSLPITIDDGSITVFEGCRVQHNAGKGPYFGPAAAAARLTIDELRALAGWMTWKCSLLDIPFGGSAGGIRIDPSRHSEAILQRAVRRFVSMLATDLGQDHDVFSSDRATDDRVMAWVMDTISMPLAVHRERRRVRQAARARRDAREQGRRRPGDPRDPRARAADREPAQDRRADHDPGVSVRAAGT